MENFDLLKKIINKVGIKFISKKLGVNVGTIKRWIELKNVPNYYKIDLMELNDITIDYSVLNAKEKDQFFTCNETAKKCFSIFLEKMNELNIDISEYTFVEPSVGSGSFYSLFPKDNRIGIDIESSINEVIISDYLKWSPDESKKYIVLGNPPFGLRGNMALRFLNHSNYADFVAFILPQIFESDGKGSCKKRVKGLNLIYSEIISPNFYFPDGKIVKVNVVFQIWSKHHIVKKELKTCNEYIKLYSISDGGTISTTRNKKMINKCDWYLPLTCFGENKMKLYDNFLDLPKKTGYGIIILKNKEEITNILKSTDWSKIAFKSTNSAYNLRFDLIYNVLIENNFLDKDK